MTAGRVQVGCSVGARAGCTTQRGGEPSLICQELDTLAGGVRQARWRGPRLGSACRPLQEVPASFLVRLNLVAVDLAPRGREPCASRGIVAVYVVAVNLCLAWQRCRVRRGRQGDPDCMRLYKGLDTTLSKCINMYYALYPTPMQPPTD